MSPRGNRISRDDLETRGKGKQMHYQPASRSFYAIVAFGALLGAGGTVSLVASARQTPPSAAQSKKAMRSAPPLPAAAKQVPLPGFDKPGDVHRSQKGDPISTVDPQKQGHVILHEPDGDLKTGIYKARDVVYTEGDMKFTGQTAVYNENTLELDTRGSLVLDDPGHHVTGDKCHVFRTKRLAVMTGNIIITLKPTPPSPDAPANADREKQRQYPVIITCDHADDFYKKNFIVLKGHLIFKQMILKNNGKTVERTLTAEHAEYDGKTNKMHLFQPVNAYDSEGQKSDFEADVFVGTKEGEETLTSPGKMTVRFNPDEAPEDDTSADKTPPVPKPPK